MYIYITKKQDCVCSYSVYVYDRVLNSTLLRLLGKFFFHRGCEMLRFIHNTANSWFDSIVNFCVTWTAEIYQTYAFIRLRPWLQCMKYRHSHSTLNSHFSKQKYGYPSLRLSELFEDFYQLCGCVRSLRIVEEF